MKQVLITGASKGIGLAIAQLLSDSGYTVIGLARSSNESFPGELFTCDLGNIEQTELVLQQIAAKYTNINYIINNVGVANPEPLGKITLSTLQNVFDLNVRTTVQVTQFFIERMQNMTNGRIINLSSLAIFGLKDRSSYSAAKAALIGLTRTWALELAPHAITVNAIAPGPVETELFRKTRPIGSQAEIDMLDTIPLNRIGKPQEIAATIKFLLSDDAGYITGQTICIDGGASI